MTVVPGFPPRTSMGRLSPANVDGGGGDIKQNWDAKRNSKRNSEDQRLAARCILNTTRGSEMKVLLMWKRRKNRGHLLIPKPFYPRPTQERPLQTTMSDRYFVIFFPPSALARKALGSKGGLGFS